MKRRTKIKVCGIREVEHGLAAIDAGAEYLGFVFYPPSHRNLALEEAERLVGELKQARPFHWKAVGVFDNERPERMNLIVERVGLDLAQLCGHESPEECARVDVPIVKVVRIDEQGLPAAPTDPAAWNAERVLLDSARPGDWGGTGESYPWSAVRPIARQAILAVGLRPDNVAEAVALAEPWGVDVSSGVERDRRKDISLIRRFIDEVHGVE